MLGLLTTDLLVTTLAGAATKGIGSYFRIKDDKDAPDVVRVNTIRREGILLGLTTVFTAGSEMLRAGVTKALQNKYHFATSGAHWKLVAIAPISAGIFLAETVSRVIAPKTPWNNPLRQDDTAFNQKAQYLPASTIASLNQASMAINPNLFPFLRGSQGQNPFVTTLHNPIGLQMAGSFGRTNSTRTPAPMSPTFAAASAPVSGFSAVSGILDSPVFASALPTQITSATSINRTFPNTTANPPLFRI